MDQREAIQALRTVLARQNGLLRQADALLARISEALESCLLDVELPPRLH